MCWYPPNGVRTVAEQARKPGGDHGRPLEVACRAGWPRGPCVRVADSGGFGFQPASATGRSLTAFLLGPVPLCQPEYCQPFRVALSYPGLVISLTGDVRIGVQQFVNPTFDAGNNFGTPFEDLWLHFWRSLFQVTQKSKGFFSRWFIYSKDTFPLLPFNRTFLCWLLDHFMTVQWLKKRT